MKERWLSLRCVRGVLYDLEENPVQTQILSHFLLISARDLLREPSQDAAGVFVVGLKHGERSQIGSVCAR